MKISRGKNTSNINNTILLYRGIVWLAHSCKDRDELEHMFSYVFDDDLLGWFIGINDLAKYVDFKSPPFFSQSLEFIDFLDQCELNNKTSDIAGLELYCFCHFLHDPKELTKEDIALLRKNKFLTLSKEFEKLRK